MDMYDGLARAYDEIFPPNPATIERLDALGIGPGKRVLDLGCATGGHVLALARRGVLARGVDPSEALLAKARELAADLPPEPRAAPRFALGGMLDFDRASMLGPFEALLCLGNTLPHLSGTGQLSDFLALVSRHLRPDGLLVIQVLNYDALLEARPPSLPSIETERWRFERSFHWLEDDRVDFTTRLSERATGALTQGHTILSAFRPTVLAKALSTAGFAFDLSAGDWSGRPFDAKADRVLVIAARRVMRPAAAPR